ncbi:ATP-binding cassette domain-containing protein [bacterium]|nr:ATP-binding cassette domain-containing protein [bacterium]
MVKVENLQKIFYPASGEVVRAVDGIDFEVNEGEIYGLLGPNGAGKTTTLRMISTVLEPTAGTAIVNGYNTAEESDMVRKQLGFLSGNTGLYKRLTAFEMVEYFGKLYGMEEAELKNKIDKLFGMLDMTEFRDTHCSKLSSGTKQKVNIARTIVHDPPVLVFDEPTEGLDVIVAHTLLEFIKKLRDEGKCIVFSTHIMKEAEELCDKIGIIDRGKIKVQGTLQEILQKANAKNLEEVFFNYISKE